MSFHDLKDALLPYTEDQDEATSVLRSRRRPSILVHTGQLPHQHAVHGIMHFQLCDRRSAIIVLSLLAAALFAGIIFGWSAFSSVLIDDGFYSSECALDDMLPCAAMEQAATVSFAVGSSTLLISSLPSGLLVDRAPPALLIAAAGVLFVGSTLALGWLPATTAPLVIHIAFACLSAGGQLAFLTAFHAVELIDRADQCAWFVSALSALSSLSAVVPLGFQWLRSTLHLGRDVVLPAYALLSAIIFVGWGTLWHWQSVGSDIQKGTAPPPASDGPGDPHSGGRGAWWRRIRIARTVPGLAATLAGAGGTAVATRYDGTAGTAEAAPAALSTYRWYLAVDFGVRHASSGAPTPAAAVPPLHERTLAFQILSPQFALDCGWLAISLLRINLYVASAAAQLRQLGDASGAYQAIFVGLMPAGIVFVGASPLLVKSLGLLGALGTASLVGLGFVGASLVPMLEAQLVTFALAIAYRTLIFALHTIFVHNTFGSRSMSTLLGLAFLLCAAPNACTPLVTALVATHLDGKWHLVNVCSAGLGALELLVLLACARCWRSR